MSSLFTDIEEKLAQVTGVDFRIFVPIEVLSWLPSLLRSKFIPQWLCWRVVLGFSFVEAVAEGVLGWGICTVEVLWQSLFLGTRRSKLSMLGHWDDGDCVCAMEYPMYCSTHHPLLSG